ncbi:hypothetical protein [Streptomyces adustus]
MDDPLPLESFFEGAEKAAHRGIRDHARAEYEEFTLHGGFAAQSPQPDITRPPLH